MIVTLFHARDTPYITAPRKFRNMMRPALEQSGMERDVIDKFLLAMSEIVINLSEHSLPKPSEFAVTVRREGPHLTMEVMDDGGSTVPQQIEALDLATTSEPRENGMGLAMVRTMFDRIDYLPAEDGKHNRFTVSLESGLPKDGRSTILLVDDDPTLLIQLSGFLAEEFEVVAASSVQDAIRALDDHRIDLIISDIRMPGTTGLEFKAHLAEDDETALIPFIFLTGASSEDTQRDAGDLAIDDYLVKPVGKRALVDAVTRLLRRSADLRRRYGDFLDKSITEVLAPRLSAEVTGYHLASYSRAADAGGGDMLFERRHDQGTFVVLADLMGHGDQAKFFSHAYAGFFRGLFESLPTTVGPAKILDCLSNAVADETLMGSTLATVLVADLRADGDVRIASAGHVPPVLCTSAGAKPLVVNGPLPGLCADHAFEEIRVQLHPGQRIALFTDGMFERMESDHKSVLPERFLGVLGAASNYAAEQAVHHVFKTLAPELDDFRADDATLAFIEAR